MAMPGRPTTGGHCRDSDVIRPGSAVGDLGVIRGSTPTSTRSRASAVAGDDLGRRLLAGKSAASSSRGCKRQVMMPTSPAPTISLHVAARDTGGPARSPGGRKTSMPTPTSQVAHEAAHEKRTDSPA